MTDLSAPPPPLPLFVNIQLNYDDYRRARGLHDITARTFWLQMSVFCITLSALLHAYQGRLGTILMTACTSIVILLPIFVRRGQFDANKNLHQPFSIMASENGVDTRYAYAGFQTQWNGFLYFVENKHDLLLYWQTNHFLICPKRFSRPSSSTNLPASCGPTCGQSRAWRLLPTRFPYGSSQRSS